MNFIEKKKLIQEYLDKYYAQMKEDLANCRDYESVKDYFNLEYKKLRNYIVVVKEDLLDELTEELSKADNPQKKNVLEQFDAVADKYAITKADIKEEMFIDIIMPPLKQESKPINTKDNTLIFIAAGAALGGGIGLVVAESAIPVVAGAAAGGVIGGIIGHYAKAPTSSIKEPKTDLEVKRPIKKLNQTRLQDYTDSRRIEIKSMFSTYIGKLEDIYSSNTR